MNKYNTPEIRKAREEAWSAARAKAKKIVDTMTLKEKISQLTQYTPYFYCEEDYNPPVDDSGAGEMTFPRVGSFLNALGAEETNRIQKKVIRDQSPTYPRPVCERYNPRLPHHDAHAARPVLHMGSGDCPQML